MNKVKIKWLGHACFLLSSDGGVKILTDPFDNTVGYEVPSVEADIVTTSHDHFDHNYVAAVKGNYEHICDAGKFDVKGIEITGVETFHDDKEGTKRGKNIVYKFNIDGINVCHCGDLGHVLLPDQIEKLGKVDVLLVPVGGTFTVNAVKAWEVVKQLNPVITIPMHFKTEVINFPIEDVDNFLSVAGKGTKIHKQEIEINKDNLSDFEGVIVLDYK